MSMFLAAGKRAHFFDFLEFWKFLEQAFNFWNRELPLLECVPINGTCKKWNELQLFARLNFNYNTYLPAPAIPADMEGVRNTLEVTQSLRRRGF